VTWNYWKKPLYYFKLHLQGAQMKNIVVGVVAFVLSVPALAEKCVALDDQKMKDMSTVDVAVEACTARKAALENLAQTIESIGGPESKSYPSTHADFDQCMGQFTRLERVLESRGMRKGSVPELCNKAAAKPVTP
jgi:hypothetical protein